MHRRAHRNHDACVPCASPLAGVFVRALARAPLGVRMHVCVRARVYVDQSSTTSCCSSARSKLRLKKRHQKAAAAAVDLELVNASSSPAARRTPSDRFCYGCCHDSI